MIEFASVLCSVFDIPGPDWDTETRGQQSTARTLGTCTEQWKETAQIYFLPLLLWGFEPNFYIRCLGFKLFIKKILLSKCIKSNDEKLLLKYQYQHSIAREGEEFLRDFCVHLANTIKRPLRIPNLTWETIETRPITMLIAFRAILIPLLSICNEWMVFCFVVVAIFCNKIQFDLYFWSRFFTNEAPSLRIPAQF